MTSMFPDKSQGGLVVWDEETHQDVEQPSVRNVDIPDGLVANCDITAQPEGCRTPVPQSQVNAIVSELLHLFNAMDPALVWDCASLGNLSAAFINFVQSLAGGGGGPPICAAADGDGTEATAKMVYCNGNTVKLWTVHGENGLMESIQEQLCSGVNSFPDNGLDTLLYCRQGVVRTTNAQDFSNFQGVFAQAKAYRTNQMVMRNNRLYMPNAAIPSGTAFTLGTTGATWYEVSSDGISMAYDPTSAYQINTIISYNGVLYAANADIPANTPFAEGTTGATWRRVVLNNAFILDFTSSTPYQQFQVVTLDGLLYRAKAPVPAGPFNPANWDLIGGERNLYRGPWAVGNAYVVGQMVQKDGKLYSPNAAIPANTVFTIGTAGATWYEVSPSIGFAWDPTRTYPQDGIVSYKGNFFAANADMPAGIAPEDAGIGLSGQTWRQITFSGQLILPYFSDTRSYAARELVEYVTDSARSLTGIWRAKSNGHPAGPWDYANWTLIGERKDYRGEWSINDYYVPGDVVTYAGSSDPFGLFRFNTGAIGAGIAWSEGNGNAQWTLLGADSSWRGQFDQTKSYPAGSYVGSPSGVYRAESDQPAGAIVLGPGKWSSTSQHRGVRRIAQDLNAGPDDVGYYLRFESTSVKTLTLSKTVGFQVGDVLFGVSVGGQLTVAAATSDVIINSPDSLNLRNVSGATFAITYIGEVDVAGSPTYQFDLAGDIAPL